MSAKIANITLDYGYCPLGAPQGTEGWKVRSVTDSLEFNPGRVLRRDEVEDLIASPAWKVIVRGQ